MPQGSGLSTTYTQDAFTLQLNTNPFVTPACSGGTADCFGWEQFGYDSHSHTLLIQDWLINYGPTCPSSQWIPQGSDCYTNMAEESVRFDITTSDLSQTDLSGIALPDGQDDALLASGSRAFVASGEDAGLQLAPVWTSTQFGIYGDGNGAEAIFGHNTTLEPETTIISNTMPSSPMCTASTPWVSLPDGNSWYTSTKESNNLYIASSTPALSQTLSDQTMAFVEKFQSNASKTTQCQTAPGTLNASSFAHPLAVSSAGRTNGYSYVVAEGLNNSLDFYSAKPEGTWTGSVKVGASGSTYSPPSIAVTPFGQLDVVARGANNSLDYYYRPPGGAAWKGPYEIGAVNSTYSNPSIAVNVKDDDAEVVAQGDHYSLDYYVVKGPNSNGISWSDRVLANAVSGASDPWIFGDPSIVTRANGESDVVYQGGDGAIQCYVNTYGSVNWEWSNTGAITGGDPSIAARSTGEFDVASSLAGSPSTLTYSHETEGESWVSHGFEADRVSDPSIAVSLTTSAVYVAEGAWVTDFENMEGSGSTVLYFDENPDTAWGVANVVPHVVPGATALSDAFVLVRATGEIDIVAQGQENSMWFYGELPNQPWHSSQVGRDGSTFNLGT